MLLILQILFTVLAWIRGWKWKALLPLGIGIPGIFGILYLLRNILEYSQLQIIAMGTDILIVIILIIMTILPPKKTEELESAHNSDQEKLS